VSYPPIGLLPTEDQVDAKRYQLSLGYQKRYTVNELNLMGQGDVLLLYTDGLLDSISPYMQNHLERSISRSKDGTARQICEAIVADRCAAAAQTDDLSLVIIKYQ
jgi:serine phosphatase RsbU (regulator of sigma subunit)